MNRIVFLIAFIFAFSAFVSTTMGTGSLTTEAQIWRTSVDGQQPVSTNLSLPLVKPVTLDANAGDSLNITLTAKASDDLAVLTVTARGPFTFVSGQSGDSFERRLCAPTRASDPYECRFVARTSHGKSTTIIVSPSEGNLLVQEVQVKIAAAKALSSVSSTQLYYGFLVLLLIGPCLVWLRRWEGADTTALLILGLAWISLSGLPALFIDVAFALTGYALIRWIARAKDRKMSRVFLAIGCLTAILLCVKTLAPAALSPFASIGIAWLALPIGISYFIVRIVDLLLTAHSGTLTRFSMKTFLSFLFMPHTLPAGPILTYGEFQNCRIANYSIVDFASGTARASIGLTKKLVADAFILPLVIRMTTAYLQGPAYDGVYAAILLLATTTYIYLDFSAYCDIAIGVGRTGGYGLPENLNWPMLQSSIRRFWQNRHITLTNWVMRRIYFPSFLSSRSTTASILLCMMVIGVWHEPIVVWSFWAIHHGAAMAFEARFFPVNSHRASPGGAEYRLWQTISTTAKYLLGVAYVWTWVSLGYSFSLFTAPDIAMGTYISALQAPIDLARWAWDMFGR